MNSQPRSFENSIISFVHIGLFIYMLQVNITQGQLLDYFDKDLCEIKCGNRMHTLCATLPTPNCDKYKIFNIFEIPTLSNGKTLELLVNGHNGLRDRIASKANIANMVKLTWDEKLAKMAIAYFKQCQPEVEDPCTMFISDLTIQERIDYKEKEEDNHKYIAQNRYTIEAEFFPKNFVETALRSWYRERAFSPPPKFLASRNMEYRIGYITYENNFTHMANPLVANFGCSIAQIGKHYEIICNYYPYYRTKTGTMIFLSSTPASSCPAFFPLKDEAFYNLCYNGDMMEYNGVVDKMPQISFYSLIAIAEILRYLM